MPFLPYDDAKQQQMQKQDQSLLQKIKANRTDGWKPNLRQPQCLGCFYADIHVISRSEERWTPRSKEWNELSIFCKKNYRIVNQPFKLCEFRLEKPKKTLGDY